jgi:hypothetical protein
MAKVRRFLKKSGDDRNYVYNYSKTLVEKGGFVECDAHGAILALAPNPVTDAPATGIAGPGRMAPAAPNAEIAELRSQVAELMAAIKGLMPTSGPVVSPAPPPANPEELAQDQLNKEALPVDFEELTKAEIVDLAKARFGDAADHMKDYMPKATLIENFGLLEAAEGVPAPEEGVE